MKFRFKVQSYQTEAVKAVVDCFDSQPCRPPWAIGSTLGRVGAGEQARLELDAGFKNSDICCCHLQAILKTFRRRPSASEPARLRALKQTKVSR